MSTLYPMIVRPRFVERIWGDHNLTGKLGKDAPRDKPIGESWEIYEENAVENGPYAGRTIGELRAEMGAGLMGHVRSDELFPLLTKLIDAQDTLSVQVHPNDRFAHELEHQPYGKTECWYVIAAAPDAALTYGFSRDTSPEEYTRLVQEGKLDKILRQIAVQPGDVIYLPAGMVHAIGGGIMVYELQQTSDVTYRIYDWNRRDAEGHSRELHVDKARQVLDYHRADRDKIRPLRDDHQHRTFLIAGPYFCMEMIEAGQAQNVGTYNSVVAACALDQPVEVEAGGQKVRLARYSSMLIPAAAGTYAVRPCGGAKTAAVLVAYVPVSKDATRTELLGRGFSADQIDSFLAQFAPVI